MTPSAMPVGLYSETTDLARVLARYSSLIQAAGGSGRLVYLEHMLEGTLPSCPLRLWTGTIMARCGVCTAPTEGIDTLQI